MKRLITTLVLFVGWSYMALAGDFGSIKKELARAGCTEFEFMTIIESDIFERTDSLSGRACIAHDGRYLIEAGEEQYLFDGKQLYSYSIPNNQVTVETVDTNVYRSDEISFITRLDDFYTTTAVTENKTYALKKISTGAVNAPDSMLVTIDSLLARIIQFEYLDINDEPNRIIILDQKLSDSCLAEQFLPVFPDSVETIKLY